MTTTLCLRLCYRYLDRRRLFHFVTVLFLSHHTMDEATHVSYISFCLIPRRWLYTVCIHFKCVPKTARDWEALLVQKEICDYFLDLFDTFSFFSFMPTR